MFAEEASFYIYTYVYIKNLLRHEEGWAPPAMFSTYILIFIYKYIIYILKTY